jgi:molecular chaperone GrpE (heat shock protein)
MDDPARLQRNIDNLFSALSQILDINRVSKQRSSKGEPFDSAHSSIVERIVTSEPSLDYTIAQSFNTGFYIDSQVLTPEQVNVYVYKPEVNQEVDPQKKG